ncbi:MAG TPA: methylmalonyl-CoA mutase family protein, partial [Streptosporangiaceae bacterium]
AYHQKLEKGEKKVVGVNCYPGSAGPPVEILRVSHQVERDQVAELARRRAGRDQAAVDAALAAVISTARSGENMIPPMLRAALAEATLGEICGALREEWGTYSETPAF